MDEKKRYSHILCDCIGTVAFVIFMILTVAGSNEYVFVLRIIFAAIAAVFYAIRLRREYFSKESTGFSIFIIGLAISCILMNAIKLASF